MTFGFFRVRDTDSLLCATYRPKCLQRQNFCIRRHWGYFVSRKPDTRIQICIRGQIQNKRGQTTQKSIRMTVPAHLVFSETDVRLKGLEYVGLDRDRVKKWKVSEQNDDFLAHFGSPPTVIAEIWYDILDSNDDTVINRGNDACCRRFLSFRSFVNFRIYSSSTPQPRRLSLETILYLETFRFCPHIYGDRNFCL
jgi:hypothetical protein